MERGFYGPAGKKGKKISASALRLTPGNCASPPTRKAPYKICGAFYARPDAGRDVRKFRSITNPFMRYVFGREIIAGNKIGNFIILHFTCEFGWNNGVNIEHWDDA